MEENFEVHTEICDNVVENCHTPRLKTEIQNSLPSPHSPTSCLNLVSHLQSELDECLQFRISEERIEHECGAAPLQNTISHLRKEKCQVEDDLKLQCELLTKTKRESELKIFRLTKDLEDQNLEINRLKMLADELESREQFTKSRHAREMEALSQSFSASHNKISPESIPEETDQDEKVDELETKVQELQEQLLFYKDSETKLMNELQAVRFCLNLQTARAEQYAALTTDFISDYTDLQTTVLAAMDDLKAWETGFDIPQPSEFQVTVNTELDKLVHFVKRPMPLFEDFNFVTQSCEEELAFLMNAITTSFTPWRRQVNAMLSLLKDEVDHTIVFDAEICSLSSDMFLLAEAMFIAYRTAKLELERLRDDHGRINEENKKIKNESELLAERVQGLVENASNKENLLNEKSRMLEELEQQFELLLKERESLLQPPLSLKMTESMLETEVAIVNSRHDCQEYVNQDIVKRELAAAHMSETASFMSAYSSVEDQSTIGVSIDQVCTVQRSVELDNFAKQFSEYLINNEVFHPDDIPPTDTNVFYFLLERYLDLVHAYNTAREEILALEVQENATKALISHLNCSLANGSNRTNSTDGDFECSTLCEIKNENLTFCAEDLTHDPLQLTIDGMSTPLRSKQEVTTPLLKSLRREPLSSVKKTVTFGSPLLAQRVNLGAENSRLKQLLDERLAICSSLEDMVESQRLEVLRMKGLVEELKSTNKTYLEELANAGQEYAAKNDELLKQLEVSTNQNVNLRDQLNRETVDLDPSLNEHLQTAPLPEVLSIFIETIMKRCQSLQDSEKANSKKIKEELESEKLLLTTSNQELKESLRHLNFEMDNTTALLSHVNQEKTALEGRVSDLEKEVAKLKRDKFESEAEVQKVLKEMENEIKVLKDEMSKREIEVKSYLSTMERIESEKASCQKIIEAKEFELEQTLSGKAALENELGNLENITADKIKRVQRELNSIISEKSVVISDLTDKLQLLGEDKREISLKLAETENECASLRIQVTEYRSTVNTLETQLSKSCENLSEADEDLRKDNERLRLELTTLKNDLQSLKDNELKAGLELMSIQSDLRALVDSKEAECQLLKVQLQELSSSIKTLQSLLETSQRDSINLLQIKNDAAEQLNGLLRIQEQEAALKCALLSENKELQAENSEAVAAHQRALKQLISEYEQLELKTSNLKCVVLGEEVDKSKSENELSALRREIQGISKLNCELEDKLSKTTAKITLLEEEISLAANMNINLKNDVENTQKEKSELMAALSEKGQLDAMMQEKNALIVRLKHENDELQQLLSTAVIEKTAATDAVSKLLAEARNHENLVNQLEEELKGLKEENNKLSLQIGSLELAILEKNDSVRNYIMQADNQASERNELRALLEGKSGEVEKCQAELQKAQCEIETLLKSLADAEEQRDEFKLVQDISDGELKSLRCEKQQLEACLNEVSEKLTAVEELFKAAETRNAAFTAELDLVKSELSSNKNVIQKLNKELEELVLSRDAYKHDSEILQKSLKEASLFTKELDLAQSELKSSKIMIDTLNKELEDLASSMDSLKVSNEKLREDLKEADLKKYELEELVDNYKSIEAAILRKLKDKQTSDESNARLTQDVIDLRDELELSRKKETQLLGQISELSDEVRALNMDILEKQRLLNSADSKLLLASQDKCSLEGFVKKLTADNEELQRGLRERESSSDGARHQMNELNQCLENLQMKVSLKEEENLEAKRLLTQREGAITDLNIKVKELNDDNAEMLELLTEIQSALDLPKEALLGIKKREDGKSYLRFFKDRNDENNGMVKDLRREKEVIINQHEMLTVEIENLRREKVQFEIKTEELKAFGKSQEKQINSLRKKLSAVEAGMGRSRRSDIGNRRLDKLEELNEALNDLLTQVLESIQLPDAQKINLLSVNAIDRATKAILDHAKLVGENQKAAEVIKSRVDELDSENQELSDNVEQLLQENNKLELEILQLKDGKYTDKQCVKCAELKAALEDMEQALNQLRNEKDVLNQKIIDLDDCCNKLRADLEEKGEQLVRTACTTARSELRLRGASSNGMAQEADSLEQVRQLTKKCEMYKDLLRSRSQIIKELEAQITKNKAPLHSNSMDSPIREQSYNLRTRGDVAAAYKKAVRQKAFGIENA